MSVTLGELVKDAAIANLNEDMQELNELLKSFPEEIQKQIITSCASLEKALEVVPDNFEQRYLEAIGKAIDLAGELDSNTNNIHQTLLLCKKELLSTFESELKAYQREAIKVLQNETERCVNNVEDANRCVVRNARNLDEVLKDHQFISNFSLWMVAAAPAITVAGLLIAFWAALLR
ncbi:hypothetical protein ACP6H1_27360 [Vibrio harveyi]|uniref:hypothetical protein n=1 Tax=Vibrio harveyi TaxID=669 RepID=UPI003CF591CA